MRRSQPKQICSGFTARRKLLRGALTLAKAVAMTYGPNGRHCLMDRMAGLLVTRDGVTVAREVQLAGKTENLGAALLKEACITVNDEVGDGTTTTAILAAAFLEKGERLIAAGHDPNEMIRGMHAAGQKGLDFIAGLARPVDSQAELERVALLASNGDHDLAKALSEACMAVGKEGVIRVIDSVGTGIELDLKDGMEIDQGLCSLCLWDDEKREREMDGPLVAIIDQRLVSVDDIKNLLEEASQWPRDLLVFCLGIDGPALATVVFNNRKKITRAAFVGVPGTAHRKLEGMGDLAALTGATIVSHQFGLDHRAWKAEWFGALRKAYIRVKNATLVAYDDADVDARIQEHIKRLRAEEATCKSTFDQDRLQERRGQLAGGVALLRVGDFTEIALKERRARVEDALGAVRAAVKGGVVASSGTTYLYAARKLKRPPADQTPAWLAGWQVVRHGLVQPLIQLAHSAGQNGRAVAQKLLDAAEDPDWGFDATTGTCRDILEDPPIIDPVLVTLAALRSALSVAATMLTVEVAICFKDHPSV